MLHYSTINAPTLELLRKLQQLPSVFMASKKDISAMKLAAITGRGSKKDFIDIYFLFQEYSLEEMLSFYLRKYPDGSDFLVLKSLSYFEDADLEPLPYMFHPIEWDAIKKYIASFLEK